MYQPFPLALQVGHANEQAIIDELNYHGIAVYRPEGKSAFDFQLSDGRKAEVKLDLFSQRTRNGVIEGKSIIRPVDLFFHTYTMCKVYTSAEYWNLYKRGKVAQIGEFKYDAHYVPYMWKEGEGKWLQDFINTLEP